MASPDAFEAFQLSAPRASAPEAMKARTLPDLLFCRVAETPDGTAFRWFDEVRGDWVHEVWRDFGTRITRFEAAFLAEKLAPGDRIAIHLPNSVDWIALDIAAMRAGLVVVPLFLADAAETTSFILRDSGARLLFVERAEDWEQIDASGASPIARVVFRTGSAHPSDGRQINLADWIAAGTRGQAHPPAERPTACGSDLATIVYTSGTAGRPKGVMLTHSALLAVSRSILERAPGTADDIFLSYLPLAHIFERVVGIIVPATIGATVVFARSIADLPADLRVVRPTILLAVPSLLDRVRGRVLARVADSAFRAWLLELTVSTGMTCYEARRDGHRAGVANWLLHKILSWFVARPILAAPGGRVRLVVAGGAPLSREVARFFLGIGLPLTEGYGLTETASAACAARRGLYWPGTVGTPLDGVSVRLGADDEILIKSPGQMLGYWRNETQTRAAFVDGWLRTGDVGVFENGQLKIAGRLKDLIVFSTGEKLSPAPFEIAISQDDLVAAAMLFGDGLRHAVALTVLDADLWREAVTALNLPVDLSSLGRPEFEADLLARIKARMAGAPRYAEVRAVHATLDAWTVENGLLTPTMKPKRGEIAKRYAREIKAAAARAAATNHRQMD